MQTDNLAEKYGAHNYHPLPVVLTRGEGAWVWDSSGKRYLDCLAAYSALNHGHRHPRILAAVQKQLGEIAITSRAFHNDRLGPFLQLACETFKMDRALPMNSGAEAVETAVKLARKWGYESKNIPDQKAEILVAENNFHGRTTTVISFSTEPEYRRNFGPFTPGFKAVPYGDTKALAAAITPHTAAILLEPIQGEAGVIIPPPGYLAEVQALCRKHNVLLALDEIQTGLGRTGKWSCFEYDAGVKPDILILGKALGGGVYPVSLTLARSDVMELLRPGHHGSTFGGNPLAAAIGCAAIEVLRDECLVERSAEMGAYLMKKLEALPTAKIENLRGRGLMVGIELKKSAGPARPYCERLAKLGMLCKETHEQVIRITPPLVVSRADLDFAFEQLVEAVG